MSWELVGSHLLKGFVFWSLLWIQIMLVPVTCNFYLYLGESDYKIRLVPTIHDEEMNILFYTKVNL